MKCKATQTVKQESFTCKDPAKKCYIQVGDGSIHVALCVVHGRNLHPWKTERDACKCYHGHDLCGPCCPCGPGLPRRRFR